MLALAKVTGLGSQVFVWAKIPHLGNSVYRVRQ